MVVGNLAVAGDTSKAGKRRTPPRTTGIMDAGELPRLIEALAREGYTVIGPVVRDGAIIYDRLDSAEGLPTGWTDEQEAGRYRLQRRRDAACFGYTVGPQSWKKYLHPADVRLWSAEQRDGTFHILNNDPPRKVPFAFIGVRACELAAIAIQDRVLLEDKYRDPIYAKRRESLFIVAVQCTQAAPTCFCTSMGTGPRVTSGFDLRLTELLASGPHRFLVEAGSRRGAALLTELEIAAAAEQDLQAAEAAVQTAAGQQTRKLDSTGVKELLYQNFEHPHWEEVAQRCLACTNCTMVCPTCFCTTVEDYSDIAGQRAERWRRWDSCFTLSFSYIHGGSIRNSAKARFRHWMTHKLASWYDQFGTSGCVGCGRCITWCPAGIDLTAELQAIREGDDHGNT